jgi:2,4-dienoyl-CoA reductase-like NADH-dependent reductase (Old Yellow Enzyme family)
VEHGSPIFEPLRIGSLDVAGRVFKAATSECRASPEGFVTDSLIGFYEPMARGGTPLIISGNTYVSIDGKATHGMCGVDADDKLPGLRRLAERVHAHGSAMFLQLNHCGRQVLAREMGLERAVSASAVYEPMMGTRPRALRVAEIQALVDAFAAAAARAQAAGFDGVQVHAGHGYLISQFLSPHTNRRRDEYGGSAHNRLRLLVEVHQAIRARVGRGFPVILKLNGHDALPLRRGLATPELVEIARRMQDEGIDAVEISVGHYESGFPMLAGSFAGFYGNLYHRGIGRRMSRARRWALRSLHPALDRLSARLWPSAEGFNLRYAREFKRALRIPVICVGGFHSRAVMEAALRSGGADAISCGRPFIADPYLYAHLRRGEPGPRCDYCNVCLARAGSEPVDCHNPRVRPHKDAMLAREKEERL